MSAQCPALSVPPAAAVWPASLAGSAPPYDDRRGRDGAPVLVRRGPGPAVRPALAAGGPPPGWPQHVAQLLAETLSGARSPRQMAPWTTGQARRHIERLGPALALDATPQVRRLVTFRPCADVLEMTVLLGVGPQTRALAVRLERDRLRAAPPPPARTGPWRCTAVEAA